MKRNETPWSGWYFVDGYLVDSDGNRYSQDMIRSSVWTQQLKRELTGTELKIFSLKQASARTLSRTCRQQRQRQEPAQKKVGLEPCSKQARARTAALNIYQVKD